MREEKKSNSEVTLLRSWELQSQYVLFVSHPLFHNLNHVMAQQMLTSSSSGPFSSVHRGPRDEGRGVVRK